MEELNRRLAEAADRYARLEKLNRQAARLRKEYEAAVGQAERLKAALAKEQRDVERLESGSLWALLTTMFADRTERLDRERQEAAEALVRYEEARQHAEQLRRDLQTAEREAANLAGADTAYRELLAEKEQRLRSEQGPAVERLLALDREEADASRRLREIAEALDAGQSACMGLRRVTDLLRSAESWGTWDMLGGGLLSTMVKHSRIDDARAQLNEVRHALDVFRRELADVGGVIDLPSVDLDGFTRFADYFWDNFFVDWIVQSRIGQALRAVQDAQSQVLHLLDWLAAQKGAMQASLDDIRRRREQFIVNDY
ncbi:putative nucleic acid-binding Zn-ribbon protein [Symbiobacterium terraclitae]|uniref:Nucleic acid-binding Zn-ribbon protein n=1 Tax=Symbiobacterium terraclitae TaxID=557451 RepID=A0ABS4JTY9_9FIRM|nr:hypothetical protein [Symbiobacterium terraclitae]MBP2018995.1 putative nucleic acid-binding Zn-ribbon protein [Symbiobacterium terraclitae]